jgi:hypothetical protein
MNRRAFVLASVTAAGSLGCALPAVPASATFAVIFDRRFEAAQAFGSTAAWRGHRVFGYDGDLTALWRHELEPRWSRRAGALAGMTTAPALFCLEQLAAQHWLRVVHRSEHRAVPGQTLISWVIA